MFKPLAESASPVDAAAILKGKIRTAAGSDGNTNIVVGPIRLPVDLDGRTVTFSWYSWLPVPEAEAAAILSSGTDSLIRRLTSMNLAEKQQSSVLVYGDFEHAERALVRMHSICHTGDIFGSKRCDCGFQLRESMKMIVDNGAGALFYLANHEGRGIGLFSKAMAYLLQENGYDTVEANLELGFADDARDYADAIGVLRLLRARPVTLITNNPKKLDALRRAGLAAMERVPLWGSVSSYNEAYLQTKIARSGHLGSLPDSAAR